MKLSQFASVRSLLIIPSIFTLSVTCSFNAGAQPESKDTATYASDEDRFDGDRLLLRVNANIFKPVNNDSSTKCAPRGSKMAVTKDDGSSMSIRFVSVPDEADWKKNKSALTDCPIAKRVNNVTQYTVSRADLDNYDFGRSGVTFGGLIVPFKFYLGGDNRITASSMVAPYVGFRFPDFFGITLQPVLSAGLGLVPVVDSTTNTTETKASFSTAVGFVFTSSKSDSFNSGLIFGKDFLSEADQKADPQIDKVWMSIYVGYSL